jgi:RHS repeat-associated protein
MLSRLRSAGDVATVTMLPNAKLCVSAERETLVPLARLLTTRGAVSLRIVPSGPTYNVAESPISRVRIGSDEIGQYAISLTMSDPKSFRKFTGDHLNGLLGVIWQSSNASNSWYSMIYDRDQTGTSVNQHFSVGASAGFSMLTVDNIHPFNKSCSAKTSICSVSGTPPSPSVGGPAGPDPYQTPQALMLDATREDGYFDGTLTIQGARAYDPNMNQWTTPDAYSGDVHDPMSQHPYMWNDNNPVQYSDPSGYESADISLMNVPQAPIAPANTDIVVKVEVSASIGILSGNISISALTAPGLYVAGGGSIGPSKTPISVPVGGSKLGFGGAALIGVATAKPGQTTSKVMTTGSTGWNAGWGVGVEHTSNSSGTFNGFGWMTPQAGGVGSYGVQLLGGPGQSPPVSSSSTPTKSGQQQ